MQEPTSQDRHIESYFKRIAKACSMSLELLFKEAGGKYIGCFVNPLDKKDEINVRLLNVPAVFLELELEEIFEDKIEHYAKIVLKQYSNKDENINEWD